MISKGFSITFTLIFAWSLVNAPGQETRRLIIEKSTDPRGFLLPVPVHITGFSADAKAVMENDLLFMGFDNVAPNEAKYIITGKNNSERVEVRVTDRISGSQVFGKAYRNENQRAVIHILSDGIAETITGLPGIAQTKIAFRTDVARGKTEIYIADFDGYNAQAVTRDDALTTAPSWAGKGTLYYSSYKLGNPKVYSHQLSSGARKLITPFAGSNISPAASPDGSRVAMILSKSGWTDLYVCNADGSGLRRLTKSKADESSPCWSPDGRTVLFTSRERGPARLFTIPAAGGPMTMIKSVGVGNATEPDWSPDGKWIVFTTLVRAGFQVCLVPVSGGAAEVLVEGEDPSWAPNSRAVIYCKGPDRGKNLFLLDVPTKQIKSIRRISMSNSQPNWAN